MFDNLFGIHIFFSLNIGFEKWGLVQRNTNPRSRPSYQDFCILSPPRL